MAIGRRWRSADRLTAGKTYFCTSKKLYSLHFIDLISRCGAGSEIGRSREPGNDSGQSPTLRFQSFVFSFQFLEQLLNGKSFLAWSSPEKRWDGPYLISPLFWGQQRLARCRAMVWIIGHWSRPLSRHQPRWVPCTGIESSCTMPIAPYLSNTTQCQLAYGPFLVWTTTGSLR